MFFVGEREPKMGVVVVVRYQGLAEYRRAPG
jgi:hypothetical protein